MRRHYKKSKNLHQITGKRQVHPSIKSTVANDLWYRKRKKISSFFFSFRWQYLTFFLLSVFFAPNYLFFSPSFSLSSNSWILFTMANIFLGTLFLLGSYLSLFSYYWSQKLSGICQNLWRFYHFNKILPRRSKTLPEDNTTWGGVYRSMGKERTNKNHL